MRLQIHGKNHTSKTAVVVQSAVRVKLLEQAGQAAALSIQSANLTLLSVDGACVFITSKRRRPASRGWGNVIHRSS